LAYFAAGVSLETRRRAIAGDDEFDQLIASLGDILAFSDDGHSLGGGIEISDYIDATAIRNQTGLSQAAFARRIGVSVGTIRNWEQGRRVPQGPARILLALLNRNPRIVEETLG
jgi:putative transcriptional regulator